MPRKIDLATLREREARARAKAVATRKQLAITQRQIHQAERDARRAHLAALGAAIERVGLGHLTPDELEAVLRPLCEGHGHPQVGCENGDAEKALHATDFVSKV